MATERQKCPVRIRLGTPHNTNPKVLPIHSQSTQLLPGRQYTEYVQTKHNLTPRSQISYMYD